MKKFRFAGLLIAAFVLTMAFASVAFAGAQDFVLVNTWIYQDELGKNQVLWPGQEIFLDFDPQDNVQYWDIKVVYDNGNEEFWYGLVLFRLYPVPIRTGTIATIDTVSSDKTAS